jgi:hypothetical protein
LVASCPTSPAPTIYDRYEYLPGKKRAFDVLAQLIFRILNPPADNVTPLNRIFMSGY